MDLYDKLPKLKGILRFFFCLGPHVFETSKVLLFYFCLQRENIPFLLSLCKKMLFCTISYLGLTNGHND